MLCFYLSDVSGVIRFDPGICQSPSDWIPPDYDWHIDLQLFPWCLASSEIYRVSRKFLAPLRFWDSRHARKPFRIYSVINSPSLSIAHAKRLIQLCKTLCTSSKLGSSYTFLIAPSMSSLELQSRSFTTVFNVPKSQSRRGIRLANRIGALMVKHDASRILMPLLTHYGTLNRPYVPRPVICGIQQWKFTFSVFKSGKM
jgi:hypothetical protein